MKKFLALLAATAVVFGVLAGCTAHETTTAETTASALQNREPKVVTEETTLTPEVTEAAEVQTTVKAEDPKKEEKTQKKENPFKDNKPEVSVSDPTKAVKADVKVSKEDAKKTVLAHAGLNESDVKFYKAELDRERNGLVYEVEFNAGNFEYDYEVSAENGKVLKAEKEFRD